MRPTALPRSVPPIWMNVPAELMCRCATLWTSTAPKGAIYLALAMNVIGSIPLLAIKGYIGSTVPTCREGPLSRQPSVAASPMARSECPSPVDLSGINTVRTTRRGVPPRGPVATVGHILARVAPPLILMLSRAPGHPVAGVGATSPATPRFFLLSLLKLRDERLRKAVVYKPMLAAVSAPAMPRFGPSALVLLVIITLCRLGKSCGCRPQAGYTSRASGSGAAASMAARAVISVMTMRARERSTLDHLVLPAVSLWVTVAMSRLPLARPTLQCSQTTVGVQDPPRTVPCQRLPRLQLEGGLTLLCSRLGRAVQFKGPVTGLGSMARSTRGSSRSTRPTEFVGWSLSLGPRAHGAVLRRRGDLGAKLLNGRPYRFLWMIMRNALSGSGFVVWRSRCLPRPLLPSDSPRYGEGWLTAAPPWCSTMPPRTLPRGLPSTPSMGSQLTTIVS